MFEYFNDLAPENEEQLSETRVNKIKASVLSRVLSNTEEEKPMKKHFSIKPFIIAAAIMTTGAVSVLGASAATKNTSDRTAPITITYQQTNSGDISENMAGVTYTYTALAEIGTIELTENIPEEVKLEIITLSDGEEWAIGEAAYFEEWTDDEDMEIVYKTVDADGAEIFKTAVAKAVYGTIDNFDFGTADADSIVSYNGSYTDWDVSIDFGDSVEALVSTSVNISLD